MKTIASTLFILALATGCVTTGPQPAEVGVAKGRPSQPILAKLGPPTTTQATADGTVYSWRTEVLQESAAVTTTRIDYSSGRPMPIEETTFQPQMQYCTLVLTTDRAGNVSDFSRDGSRQACAPLLDKLGMP
jgi:hypothetical protein